jgi:hypothetical protein
MMPYAPDSAWWPEYAPDEILPGLWQGGTEDDEVVGCRAIATRYDRRQPFDLVVTLYADAMPAAWGVEELRFGFPDSDLTAHAVERAAALARYAHQRWHEGARVLVRCQAGVNRSGLVMALTLMHDGLSARDAIALIRSRRSPAVLNNGHFVRWLITEAPAHVPARRSTPSSSTPTAA